MRRSFEILLTVAASALVIAFFASVPHWPAEWTARASAPPFAVSAPLLRGPSVLANARPAPALNPVFPADAATVIRRTGVNGETGLIPTGAAITTYRLADGEIVTIASVPGADAVTATDGGLLVHGRPAVGTVERGITRVRWTENGVTYEIASRTLDVARLTEVANRSR